MLQTLEVQHTMIDIRVMGVHHLPENLQHLAITFREAISICKTPLPNGDLRVFHARRNDEMIQALTLKWVFGAKIKICFTSTAQRYHSKFSRWLMSKMDGIITTCNAANSFLNPPAERIIPHGIQSNVYTPSKNKEKSWYDLSLSGQYGLGIFGRVRPQKGIDIFVDACIEVLPKHPQFTAIVVGAISSDNSDFADKLKLKIDHAKLSTRILFLGELEFSELPKLFNSVHLACALSRNEGFGLTVLEAMSSATAVCASKAGAWEDIINYGVTGSIVDAGNLAQTCNALDDLLASPENLIRMGLEGRNEILKNYTIDRESHALCEYYASLQSRY